MTKDGFYLYELSELADQYRAEHRSHEAYFPNDAELGKLIDETVEDLRAESGNHQPTSQLTRCHQKAEQARKEREGLVEKARENKRHNNISASSYGI